MQRLVTFPLQGAIAVSAVVDPIRPNQAECPLVNSSNDVIGKLQITTGWNFGIQGPPDLKPDYWIDLSLENSFDELWRMPNYIVAFSPSSQDSKSEIFRL